MKTVLKILIILIILGAIGFGVYTFFSKQEAGGSNPFSDGVSVGDFFPFGNSNGPITNTPDTTGNNTNTSTNTPTATEPQRLWQIYSEPQSGAVAFNASGTPTVRFVDKATGNIYESSLLLTGSKRISNTTVPKVHEALWEGDGSSVTLRYLGSDGETARTVLGTLSGVVTTTEGEVLRELKTSFLPDNIKSISVEPLSGTQAYLTTNQSGSRVSVTTATTPKLIFESVIKDFSVSWVNKSTIALMTKPSAASNGQLYFLRSDNGLLSRVLGGQTGLSALSNATGTRVIYSESTGSSFKTSVFDIKGGVTNELTLKTLAEKCVWSAKSSYVYCAIPQSIPNAVYPDDWYKGKVSFNDNIWQIDTLTGTTKLIIDPSSLNITLDAVSLALDPNENYLVFTNKKDSKLWGLKI